MAGGGVVGGPVKVYNGHVTLFVVIICIVAASGGLIFGYDLGISGGVTSMDSFLIKFFPVVYHQRHNSSNNKYCQFDSQILTTFTSSLYVAGLITSFFASITTRKFGRKPSMLIGGISFLVGAVLNGAAQNISMLIIGRILLGVGIGFTGQSAPVYLSEMAPANMRGALNIMLQLAITIGILSANLINYGTQKIKGGWGWRLSLGLGAVPALIFTIGSMFLPDTPNSLIERGQLEEGHAMLVRIRGTESVDEEFNNMVLASERAKTVKHPWRNITQRQYRPQIVMSILIPFFQQFTGINAIMFYAPVLFSTIGFGQNASLYSAVIIGMVNVFATVISIIAVDRYGRRVLFMQGGMQMLISQVIIGAILGVKFGKHGVGTIGKGDAIFVVVMVCLYVASFAWSWGPLGILVPSEIFPLEIRSAGQSINVSVNLLFTFVVAQAFLSMLCHFKFGIFLFFAGWVLIMTIFVYFFFPETKNVPIDEMVQVCRNHPYWSRFILLSQEDDAAHHK